MRIAPLLLLATVVFAAEPVTAQDADASRTSVYLEVLGPTEIGSINVDRESHGWLLRGGLQIAGSGSSLGQHYLQLPMSVGRLAHVGGFGLEAGAGTVLTINDQYGWSVFEHFGSAAVRSPRLVGSTFIRAEALVFPTDDWRRTVGIGVGYAF